MADIQPIQGPIGPEHQQHRREQKKLGTPEEFKKTYRVQAVDDTDAEAQSKKKRQKQGAEEEDANQAEEAAAPTTPTPPSTSPFEIQKPEKKAPGIGAAETPQTSVPYDKSYTPSGSFTALGDEEDTDDFISNLPNAPTPSTPSTQQVVSQPPQNAPPASTPTEEGMTYSEGDFYTQPPQSSQSQTSSSQATPSQQSTTPSSTTTPPSSAPTPAAPPGKVTGPSKDTGALAKQAGAVTEKEKKPSQITPVAKQTSATVEKEKKPSQTAPSSTTSKEKPAASEAKPIVPPKPTDTEQLVKPGAPGATPPAPPQPKAKEISPEESSLSWHEELPAVSALSSSSGGEEKKDDSRKEEEQMAASGTTPLPTDVPPLITPDTSGAQAPLPTYTTFSPAVLDMFERMVGTITVLQETAGERKTTITLTSPNFSSSVFYGAEIVIEEDLHLAPGQYNIKLVGSPEAVTLFQAKSDDLLAAFQSGGYNFKVQRLETVIQSTEKPLFKRKEGVGKDSGADAGQGDTP